MGNPQYPLIDGWMLLDHFCEKHGQKKNTIHKRVNDGAWPRGIIYSSPTGGVGYVHEQRALTWLDAQKST